MKLLAPNTARSQMRTPGRITIFEPIQTLPFMITGFQRRQFPMPEDFVLVVFHHEHGLPEMTTEADLRRSWRDDGCFVVDEYTKHDFAAFERAEGNAREVSASGGFTLSSDRCSNSGSHRPCSAQCSAVQSGPLYSGPRNGPCPAAPRRQKDIRGPGVDLFFPIRRRR